MVGDLVLGHHPNDPHGIRQALELHFPTIQIDESGCLPCQSHYNLTGKNLSRIGNRLQAGCPVERAAPVTTPHRDRVSGIQSNPNLEGQVIGVLLQKPRLQRDRGMEGVAAGPELGQRFIAAKLDDPPSPRLDDSLCQLGKVHGESSGGFIAVHLGKAGITDDVRDEKRTDL
jgi:hypothetical protein